MGSSSNRYAPRLPNQKQNHLQNSLLRRTQFWVRKTFSKPASLKRASLVFTHWEVNRTRLASRVVFQRPAHYVPEATLRQHVQERVSPIGDYVGKRKRLTGLPFRPNVMNCGSMPQGKRELCFNSITQCN